MCYRNIIIGGGDGGCCPQFRMPCLPCSRCCVGWFEGCIRACCRCISCLLFLVIIAIGIYTLYYYYLVLKLPPPIDLPNLNIVKPSAKANSTSKLPDNNTVTTMKKTMETTMETTMKTENWDSDSNSDWHEPPSAAPKPYYPNLKHD